MFRYVVIIQLNHLDEIFYKSFLTRVAMGNLKENKKRGLFFLTLITGLFSLNFVQAFLGLGIAIEDMLLVAVFIAIFWVIYFAFGKFFRDSNGEPLKTVWVPALALALGATYGIWKSNFGIEDFFLSDIGISTGVLNVIAPLIVLGFIIFLIVKMRFSRFLFLLAGAFFLSGIMGIVYESFWSILIGVILFGIGLIVHYRAIHQEERKERKLAEEKELGKTRAQIKRERKKEKKRKKKAKKSWRKKYKRGKRLKKRQKRILGG